MGTQGDYMGIVDAGWIKSVIDKMLKSRGVRIRAQRQRTCAHRCLDYLTPHEFKQQLSTLFKHPWPVLS